MKLILILTFILTLGTLTSCGPAVEEHTDTKISLGASAGDIYTGGLFFVGFHQGSQQTIIKSMIGNNASVNLKNGIWDMAVVGWLGSDKFEGIMKCDLRKNIRLDGNPVNISFITERQKCLSDMIASNNSNFKNPSNGNESIKPVRFHTCSGLRPHIIAGEISDGSADNLFCDRENFGKMKSFKVKIFDSELSQNPILTRNNNGVSSKCISVVGSDQFANSDIKLPVGFIKDPTGNFSGMKFPVAIYAYDQLGCTGLEEEFQFGSGLGGGDNLHNGFALVSKNQNFFAGGLNAESHVTAFLSSSLCSGNWLTATPFASGAISSSATNFICTANQFANLNNVGSISSNHEFEIVRDIDLNQTALALPITSSFGGSISGRNAKIIGKQISACNNNGSALFTNVVSGASFRSLTIDNLEIINTCGAASDTGLLISSLNDSIDIEDIKILNSTVRSPDALTSSSTVGGLIGDISLPVSSFMTIRNVVMENVSVHGVSIIASYNLHSDDDYAVDYTGGIVGSVAVADNTSNLSISNSRFTGLIKGGTNTGGILGFANNNGYLNHNISIFDSIVGSGNTKTNIYYAPTNSGASNVPYISPAALFINGSDDANVGGIIGYGESVRLEKVAAFTNITLLNQGQKVGGIAGNIFNGSLTEILSETNITQNYNIESTIFPSAQGQNNYIGGVVGELGMQGGCAGGSNVFINNTKSKYNISLDGQFIGGISGSLSCASDPASIANLNQIVNGIGLFADGVISDNSSNSNLPTSISVNSYRGGLFGDMSQSKIRMAISHATITGYEGIGGIAGRMSDDSILKETVSFSDLTNNSSIINTGGIIGVLDNSGNISNITDNFSNAFIHNLGSSSPTCTTGSNCGVLVGMVKLVPAGPDVTDTDSFSNVAVANIYNSAATLISSPPTHSDEAVSEVFYFNNPPKMILDTSPVSGWTLNTNSDAYNGFYLPTFLVQALKFGDIDSDGIPEIAGSNFDPYPLYDCSDFNAISDDEFLLNMSFRLANNIDFNPCDFGNSSNIVPIGSSIASAISLPTAYGTNFKSFLGSFFGNGYALNNIRIYATNGTNQGVGFIRKLGSSSNDGQVGTEKTPLILNNFNLTVANGSTIQKAGAIGIVENGNIHLNSNQSNISVNCSSYCGYDVGGLIGFISNGMITNSSYEGNLLASNISRSGGIIGEISIGDNQRVEIRNSFVDFKNLLVNYSFFGGIFGEAVISQNTPNEGRLDISKTYVWFNINGQSSASISVGADDSNTGALFGISSDNISGEIKDVYADTIGILGASSFLLEVIGSDSISMNNQDFSEVYLINNQTGTGSLSATYLPSQLDLINNEFDKDALGRNIINPDHN